MRKILELRPGKSREARQSAQILGQQQTLGLQQTLGPQPSQRTARPAPNRVSAPIQTKPDLVRKLEAVGEVLAQFQTAEYQLTSIRTWRIQLNQLKAQLESIRDASLARPLSCMKHFHLARVQEYLGLYQSVDIHYRSALPQMFREDIQPYNGTGMHYLHPPHEWFQTKSENNNVLEVLFFYLLFLMDGSPSDLRLADHILDVLPWLNWAGKNAARTYVAKADFLLLKIRLLNAQHHHEKALALLGWTPGGFLKLTAQKLDPVLSEREKALAFAGHTNQQHQAIACQTFSSALTLSWIDGGAWHGRTLHMLYTFGKILRAWGHDGVARTFLEECCTGLLYRYGNKHPEFLRACGELQLCGHAGAALRALGRFESQDTEIQTSIAIQHVQINTSIAILKAMPGMDYSELEKSIVRRSTHKLVRSAIPKLRMLAGCNQMLGEVDLAIKRLEVDLQRDMQTWDNVLLRLDLVRVASGNSSPDLVNTLVARLIRDIGSLSDSEYGQGRFRAACRSLSAIGSMHFSATLAMEVVNDEHAEILGTGTYAAVDRVRVWRELYARKSIPMPRFRQQQARAAIQNEISIIRALDHPHVIQVFFTDETSSRFFIVMEPLADCDLEVFLVQHSSTPPTKSQQAMVWKWLLCLSNTLAFIHSKGIRHKDIKSRNILVKGQDIIFADFGSSHAFLDGSDSATEGPSYGHTKMYCAPEVIQHQRRNRSADVFSLGCVFTELAVWLVGKADFDIKAWHTYRNDLDSGPDSNAYHASLEKIGLWFTHCDDDFVRRLYRDVLSPMLSRDPEKRLKAPKVTERLQALTMTLSTQIEPCRKCYLGLWIDDERFPIPAFLTQTEPASLAMEKEATQDESTEKTSIPDGLDDASDDIRWSTDRFARRPD